MRIFLKLIRWPNLLIVALTMILMRYAVIEPVISKITVVLNSGTGEAISLSLKFPWYDFVILVIATLLITAGGYVINDYFDIKTDLINRGEVIVGTKIPRRQAMKWHNILNIAGVAAGFYISWKAGYFWMGILFLIVSGLLYFYSASYKRHLAASSSTRPNQNHHTGGACGSAGTVAACSLRSTRASAPSQARASRAGSTRTNNRRGRRPGRRTRRRARRPCCAPAAPAARGGEAGSAALCVASAITRQQPEHRADQQPSCARQRGRPAPAAARRRAALARCAAAVRRRRRAVAAQRSEGKGHARIVAQGWPPCRARPRRVRTSVHGSRHRGRDTERRLHPVWNTQYDRTRPPPCPRSHAAAVLARVVGGVGWRRRTPRVRGLAAQQAPAGRLAGRHRAPGRPVPQPLPVPAVGRQARTLRERAA